MNFDLDITAAMNVTGKALRVAEDPSEPLTVAAQSLEALVRATFRDQTDPFGSAWQPLAQTTIERRGSSGPILDDTGEMLSSLRSELLSQNMAQVSIGGAGRFPGIHQFGNAGNMMYGVSPAPIPARPMFPIRPSGAVELPPAWAESVNAPFEEALAKAIR